MEESRKNYEIAMQDLVYNPGKSLIELLSLETAIKDSIFLCKTFLKQLKKILKPETAKHFKFPVLFLGAKPNNTPAFYNFMNHADFGLGTWYPKGGLMQLRKNGKTSRKIRCQILVNEEVIKIENDGDVISTVITKMEFTPQIW